MRDFLYQQDGDLVESFRFDENVAQVFADMVQRSVPGYSALLSLIGVIAKNFVTARSNCYDLGCSLGGATLAIDKGAEGLDCKIIGVDNSPSMVEQAEVRLAGVSSGRIKWVCDDLQNANVNNASLVVLNLTLQFIKPSERLKVIEDVYHGLNSGGALVISEKVKFDNPEKQNRFAELYYEFKRANNYSDLEISQKRNALEDVMILDTPKEHISRLRKAGFTSIEQCFQAFNFVSYLAIRE